ncbi:MAG: glutathione peroxidase [Myxococcota bacterium]
MNPKHPGDRVPDATFKVREGSQWKTWSTADLFAGKRVVVFSLPGAFTPTCSASHVPRYQELHEAFRAKGIDAIYCVSVNDTFVMNAWKEQQHADDIVFLPDGNGAFTEGMGLLVDKGEIGFGKRSWRYAMIVNDGAIEQLFIEPEKPGDPFEVSDADTVLKALGGHSDPDVLLFTKPGCAHCERAKRVLDEAHLRWAELPVSPRILRALPGPGTTPVVFVDGKHVGGADELVQWMQSRPR